MIKLHQRIHIKLILIFLLIILIPIFITFYATQMTSKMLYENEFAKQDTCIKNFKQHIRHFLETAENELIFLSQSQLLRNYLITDNLLNRTAIKQSIQEKFLFFLNHQKAFYQVTYLDEYGQEIIQINKDKSTISLSPSEQLQNRKDQSYFQKTMQLLEKEVFVYATPADIENHSYIQYSTPIFYPNMNKRAGIIVTYVDIASFLQPVGNIFLVDTLGNYLSPLKEQGNNLNQHYPNLATAILAKDNGHIQTNNIILSFEKIQIAENIQWILLKQNYTHEFLSQINQVYLFLSISFLVTLVFIIVVIIYLKKNLLFPITHLIGVIQQVRNGNEKVRATVSINNELGILSHELNQMLEMFTKYEQQLERKQQEMDAAFIAKSKFFADMSHELRTPLNAIIGYGEMLHEELEILGESDLSNDMTKIYSAGKYLLNTINDILDISKIEAGKIEFFSETFYLPNMLDDVAHTIQPLLNQYQEVLEVNCDPKLEDEMSGDLIKLRQVLLKILSNAAQFNQHNGNILLKVFPKKENQHDWVVFQIQDHGIGMDFKKKQEIQQMADDTNIAIISKTSSQGLALIIAHHFVKMMGGKIEIESELNQGSSFSIYIPKNINRTDHGLAAIKGEVIEIIEEEGFIVLVIDDAKEVRYVLESYLVKLGYQVKTANNGEKGLKLARRILPDIIILDVMMPKMDGWEVLSHLQASPDLANIPVIMSSMMEDKKMGYALGAVDYLTRPFTRDQLSKMLKKHRPNCDDSTHNIMVVEDNIDSCDIAVRTLKKAGYRVCKAGDGKIALNHIQFKEPDLILLDLQMPNMNGFEFISILRNRSKLFIPIILVTASDLTREERISLKNLKNIVHIFQKGSYDSNELLTEIKKAL